MANINVKKGVIGILTGGGAVPGLNPAIRAVTFRALREGYEVIGIRRGWGAAGKEVQLLSGGLAGDCARRWNVCGCRHD